MDELKKVLDIKTNSFIERIPEKGNKSIVGKQKRLNFFIENQTDFEKEINLILSEYSSLDNFDKKSSLEMVKNCFRLIKSSI
jgi:hypothetical protein